ncbi:MAG: hypothetical protein II811_07560 [Spirochaetaceae bacterium]|nr:hypothetical protein [Spirochaetaceae bacterium]
MCYAGANALVIKEIAQEHINSFPFVFNTVHIISAAVDFCERTASNRLARAVLKPKFF